MEVKIKGGRKFKLKKNISLDERDSLLDSIDWSIEERTEAFLKIQEHLNLGEGNASK